MVNKISEEAISLLKGVYNRRATTCCGGFKPSALTATRCCGYTKVAEVTPLLGELTEKGLLKVIGEGTKKIMFKLTKKAEKELEKIQEEENTIYTEEYRESLEKEIKKYKRLVVTTAVMGKDINKPFVESLRNYCKRNKALPIVLPCEDVFARSKKASPIELSPEIDDFRVVFKDIYVNKNLCLSAIKCSAKQRNPLLNMDEFATDRDASVILASPKFHLHYVPCFKGKVPLAAMTPGAITVDNYDTDRYFSQRTSTLAETDHVYGAIIIEVVDDRVFHFTHVKMAEGGSFTDKGVEYHPDGTVTKLSNAIWVMGDSHVGSHDQKLFNTIMDCANQMKVSEVILHDVFNATSVTHHDENKNITRAQKALQGLLNLEEELLTVKRYIEVVNSRIPKVTIVNSNHDNHLKTYLEKNRFTSEPQNYHLGCKLALAFIEGYNPLQYAIEEIFGLKSENIKWLSQDESYNKYGVELGLHGSEGANGARGSNRTFAKCIGNCITAHAHSAQIRKDAMVVGTTSELNLGYNHGLSSWTRTCAILYPNGTKQLINFILDDEGNYKWTL